MYKDEQLREAQGWIARAQEMDALQSSTNHSLQAELRERTEQYNQLWLGCQRQVAYLIIFQFFFLSSRDNSSLYLMLFNLTEFSLRRWRDCICIQCNSFSMSLPM